jgi:hypothetical protein
MWKYIGGKVKKPSDLFQQPMIWVFCLSMQRFVQKLWVGTLKSVHRNCERQQFIWLGKFCILRGQNFKNDQTLCFVYKWRNHSNKHGATFLIYNWNIKHIGSHPHHPGSRCFFQFAQSERCQMWISPCVYSRKGIWRPFTLTIFATCKELFIISIKSKVKSLCLIKHHTMMTNRGSGDLAPPCLTSALDGGEWSASHPSSLYPWGKNPWYPLRRRLGGHRGEEKDLLSQPGIEPQTSSPWPTEYPGNATAMHQLINLSWYCSTWPRMVSMCYHDLSTIQILAPPLIITSFQESKTSWRRTGSSQQKRWRRLQWLHVRSQYKAWKNSSNSSVRACKNGLQQEQLLWNRYAVYSAMLGKLTEQNFMNFVNSTM